MIPTVGQFVYITHAAYLEAPKDTYTFDIGPNTKLKVDEVIPMGQETLIRVGTFHSNSSGLVIEDLYDFFVDSATGIPVYGLDMGTFPLFEDGSTTTRPIYSNKTSSTCAANTLKGWKIALPDEYDPKDKYYNKPKVYSKQELKTENSKADRKECIQCKGALKEPLPGIKYCPVCEP